MILAGGLAPVSQVHQMHQHSTKPQPPRQSNFRIARFIVNPWLHRWAHLNPKHAADVSKLQSARGRKRHHGNGYARIGERDRDICGLARHGLTDKEIANSVNAAHLWHLTPIRRRRVCAIRHQHTACPQDQPCRHPDVLEVEAGDGAEPVVIRWPRDTAGTSINSQPDTAVSLGYGIGSATPAAPRRVWRTIPTRYGAFTYPHDTARWPLKGLSP